MSLRVTFLTVMPSPYQREFLGALAADEDFDLRVRYYTERASDRNWEPTRLLPFEKVMRGYTAGWLGASAHFNPSAVREVQAHKPDFVVLSDYSAITAQWLMYWMTRQSFRWIFWGEVPGMSERGSTGRMMRRLLQRPIRRSAHAVAAIGRRAQKAYREMTLHSRPVVNIPYHCDTAGFDRAAKSRSYETEVVKILFSGQMIDRKGVDTLLEAFSLVAKGNDSVQLQLVGDGPCLERYRGLVPPELRERVQFLGFRQPSELPEIFAAADIFALPSRHDGWGVVVNEAIASGLPIVASSAVAATEDLVDEGVNGFVVPPADAGALAGALRQLVGSPALREQQGRASREQARHWTLDRGVERWRGLFAQLSSKS